MNSQKVRESIQQKREKARAEYEKVSKNLLFTKDFQSRQEAIMHDPLEVIRVRVMAYILRRSWGEMVLYAMKEDGEPAYQRDIVRELRLNKKSVSAAVAYYQKRGYLEDRPKLLYPVISPALISPKSKGEKSREYETFLEGWKVSHSSDFQELEVARSTIKKINKVILSEYKKWATSRKQFNASLLKTEEIISETGQRAAVSPLKASNQKRKQAPAQSSVEEGMQAKTQAVDYLFEQIRHMQESYPKTPFAKPLIDRNDAGDVGLVNRILKEIGARHDGHYNEQRLVGYMLHVSAQFKGWTLGGGRRAERFPGSPEGPKSLGLLVNWARDYARIVRETEYGAGG